MKTRNLFMNILGVFIALVLAGTVAPAATITVLETFDFPGAGNNTLPQKINDGGLIIGSVIDSAGVTKGFLRAGSGNFSDAFVEPNDTGNLTQGRAVNNARVVAGEYLNGKDGTFHGYHRAHAIFKEYDVTGALDTIPPGLNDVGDFVGTVILSDGSEPGFLSLSGTSPCSPSLTQRRPLLIQLIRHSRPSVTI